MKILIVGLPKSGTTILTYRIAAALDDVFVEFEPVDGPDPAAGAEHRHLVTKKLVGSQTTTLADYRDYDRRIWICRDPRDFLVSQSLYRWHRPDPPEPIDEAWFDRVLAKLRAKEADPGAVPFLDLEPADYFETLDAVAELRCREVDDGWLVYRYEDMVAGRYDRLNRYLGFEVATDVEVAEGLERVARRKGAGDWRDWFTPTDVEFFAAGGLDRYMAVFGYDGGDWALNDPQIIDPAHGSAYVTTLFNDHRTATSAGGVTDGAEAGVDGERPRDGRQVRRRWLNPWSSRGSARR